MQIRVVDQENCPRCGGGSEFGNRPKVGHDDGTWSWKCYNPDCTIGFYNPETGETEDVPPPEEMERIAREAREWAATLTFGPAVHHPNGIIEYRVIEGDEQ
jgi:hypothetical protein